MCLICIMPSTDYGLKLILDLTIVQALYPLKTGNLGWCSMKKRTSFFSFQPSYYIIIQKICEFMKKSSVDQPMAAPGKRQ